MIIDEIKEYLLGSIDDMEKAIESNLLLISSICLVDKDKIIRDQKECLTKFISDIEKEVASNLLLINSIHSVDKAKFLSAQRDIEAGIAKLKGVIDRIK